MTNQTDRLLIKLETDGDGNVRASLGGVAQDLGKLDKQADLTGATLGKMKGLLAGIISVATIKAIFETTAEYQRLHAVLETVTGSAGRADQVFAKLSDFAKRTPFQLTEVVDAFAKLQARGITPTDQLLTGLGNTAAGMGKTLDQAVEALADASVGEFERLKEFGIKANAQGDKVAFTFKGVTTVVARNSEEITAYLNEIGNNDFAGAMARQADTLGGAWSNLVDSSSSLAASIGESLTPAVRGLTGALSATAEASEGFFEWLTGNINAIEQYKRGIADAQSEHERLTGAINRSKELLSDSYIDQFPQIKEAETEKLKAYEQQLAEVNNRIRGFNGLVDDELVRMHAANKEADAAAAATAGLSASTQALIDKLKEQTATYGLSKSAALEYEKAQAVAAQTTAEGKAAITAQYDALIKKVKAEEAATAATAGRVAGDKAAAAAARERAKMEREAADVIARMAEDFDDADAAAEAFEATIAALVDPLAEITLQYEAQRAALQEEMRLQTGNAAAQAKVAEALRVLDARYRATKQSVEAQQKPVQQLIKDAAEELRLMKLSNVEREAAIRLRGLEGEATQAQIDALNQLLNSQEGEAAMQRFADNAAEALTGALSGAIRSLSSEGGDIGQAMGDAFKDSLNGALDSALGNLQDQLGQAMTAMRTGGQVNWQGLGQAGGQAGLAAVGAIGASYVGGTSSMGQSVLGGAAAGAAYGTMIMPGIGTIIGAILGAVIGFVAHQDPILEVSSHSSGINHGKVEGRAQSAFGDIFVGKDDLTLQGNMQSQELADKIAAFDDAIASFLTGAEVQAAKDALANFDFNARGHGQGPAEVLEARFNAVVRAIEPAWFTFLDGIEDLQKRVEALQGLRAMRDQIAPLEDLIAQVNSGDPFEQLRFSLNNLQQAVDDGKDAFDAAIVAQDPVAIAEASSQLSQAIMRRYQAELDMLNQLVGALAQLEQQTRAFNFDIAQRIAGVGGSTANVVGVAAANLAATRSNVDNASNAEQALQHLSEFISTVDQWLQASRADVQAWYEEQSAMLANRLAALDQEVAAINAAAQLRQQSEQLWAAQVQESNRLAQEAERARLQGLLDIAQQWVGVLDNAQALIDELTRGAANPTGASGRLSMLDATLADLQQQYAGASVGQRAGIADQITQLLNERLQLAQTIYDRPSGEYLNIYNATLRELAQIRDDAVDPAAQALELQQQLADLQQGTTDAVTAFAGQSASYNAAEQQRLDEIEAERAEIALAQQALDEENAARLAAIDDEARGYYEWAQTTGQQLQAEQHQQLVDALNEITDGIPVDQYIVGLQERTTDALEHIRDSMDAFLDMVTATIVNSGGGNNPITPPREDGPGVPITPGAPGAAPVVLDLSGMTINAAPGVDGASIGQQVMEVVMSNLPAIRRELRYS